MDQKSTDLLTENTTGELSGESNCTINAQKQIKIKLSGASSVEYMDHGKMKKLTENGHYEFLLNK